MSIGKIPSVLAVLCMGSLGCGNGADDPLTGTWSNDVCFGDTEQPGDIQSCSTTLHFDADLTVTLTDTRQSLPATATYPRCTTLRMVKGLTYSTNNQGTVTFTGTTHSTLARQDCANSADNQGEIADTRDSVSAGQSHYSITDKTLTLSSGVINGQYQRQ